MPPHIVYFIIFLPARVTPVETLWCFSEEIQVASQGHDRNWKPHSYNSLGGWLALSWSSLRKFDFSSHYWVNNYIFLGYLMVFQSNNPTMFRLKLQVHQTLLVNYIQDFNLNNTDIALWDLEWMLVTIWFLSSVNCATSRTFHIFFSQEICTLLASPHSCIQENIHNFSKTDNSKI